MAIRVGINGFGRIGRLVFRVMAAQPEKYEVVAINDLTSNDMLATLLKYDSVHGRFAGTVEVADGGLNVNGKFVKIFAERDPGNLPWGDLNVDVVLESTGLFTKRAADGKPGFDSHKGCKKVVISAPATDPDFTCVLGVNDDQLTADMKYVSNASCTTNCLAPFAKVINDNFGIVKGLMTTVHSYTNDQRVLDLPHKDPYRARAAAMNMIPTSTGAAKAVGLVIPALQGKLTGISIRVPTPTGSVVDLVVETEKPVTKEAVNAAMKAAAEGPMKGILDYTEDPIVLQDIVDDAHSSIFAGPWTMVMGDNMLKCLSWYDNEWGYSNRAADLIWKMGNM
ncbi:MAG: type I glyceraldehyde-3-phosphate dehydrogenase [Thermoguttaceae bacterium]|nr:type I glyceraldehyde-3-phosphate dehydrogenase [Thermoguttaceae bacterium]MBP3693513.1 type I glyceraldehyde-3-phosphate dehydrogenase [Thermoguttaceae bacterium]